MFRSTLTDLIRGLRSNKRNEKKYITSRMDEIRNELRSTDMTRKVNAICKLCYLHMLGYDMEWASFHVIEVMASSDFYWKRQGYLAATQSFNQNTDVLMLTTNLIKKDIISKDLPSIGVAINGLSHIITPDLARDLYPDILSLTNHGRPSIRKRAVLVLYKICLKYPEALHECVPRLTERLEDTDPAVVSAAVNVICELARRNPRNYLPLAPQLFRLLTTSSNNWMLIKLIKLFALLTPLEPRLVRKLLPSFQTLIETTPAMSVLYECIRSVVTGGILNILSEAEEEAATTLAMLCASKITLFLEDSDQNLKYVGLLVLADLLERYPKLVVQHRDLILSCAEDPDLSIRIRALDLVVVLATKRTLMDIVKRLMLQLIPYFMDSPTHIVNDPDFLPLSPLYRTSVVEHIIRMCSQHAYTYVVNFEWYIAVLLDLSRVSGVQVGALLSDQLIDVAVRVKSVRGYCVRMMATLLNDQSLLDTATQPETNIEILWAAAYIVGEYNEYLGQPTVTLRSLGNPMLRKLSPALQSILIQSLLKVYIGWAHSLLERWNITLSKVLEDATHQVIASLAVYAHTSDLEVNDRLNSCRQLTTQLLEQIPKDPRAIISELYRIYFATPLNPVAPRAQRKVKRPEDIDLDQWIGKPLPDITQFWLSDKEDTSSEHSDDVYNDKRQTRTPHGSIGKRGKSEPSKGQKGRKQSSKKKHLHDPYYIQDTPSMPLSADEGESRAGNTDVTGKGIPRIQQGPDGHGYINVDTIPVVKLTLQNFNDQWQDIPKVGAKTKKTSHRSRKHRAASPSPPRPQVLVGPGEMPEGAELSASDDDFTANHQQLLSSLSISHKGKERASIQRTDTTATTRRQRQHLLGDEEDASNLQSVNITIDTTPKTTSQPTQLITKTKKTKKKKPVEQVDPSKPIKEIKKKSRPKQGIADHSLKTIEQIVSTTPDQLITLRSPSPASINSNNNNNNNASTNFIMAESSDPSALLVVRRKVDKKKKKAATSSHPVTNHTIESSTVNNNNNSNISLNEPSKKTLTPRSFTVFAQDNHLRLSYELSPISVSDRAITLDPFSQTFVQATIQLQNITSDATLRNMEMRWPGRGIIRAMGLSARNTIDITESIASNDCIERSIKLVIQGKIQSGMRIDGDLAYACEYTDRTISHQHLDWQLSVTCTDFMVVPPPTLTPPEFALALADHETTFTECASALSIHLDRVHAQLEFKMLATIIAERLLHMQVIEVVGESASLYGKSIFGHPVAGLIKRHTHILAMELKSSDKDFIEGLVEQAESFLSSQPDD